MLEVRSSPHRSGFYPSRAWSHLRRKEDLMNTFTYWQVGFKSSSGYSVRFDKQYGTEAEAAEARNHYGYGYFVWKVTVEEVAQ